MNKEGCPPGAVLIKERCFMISDMLDDTHEALYHINTTLRNIENSKTKDRSMTNIERLQTAGTAIADLRNKLKGEKP